MKPLSLVLLQAALAACANLPPPPPAAPSPCANGVEASWACQVERYQNVNEP